MEKPGARLRGVSGGFFPVRFLLVDEREEDAFQRAAFARLGAEFSHRAAEESLPLRDAFGLVEFPVDAKINAALAVFLLGL